MKHLYILISTWLLTIFIFMLTSSLCITWITFTNEARIFLCPLYPLYNKLPATTSLILYLGETETFNLVWILVLWNAKHYRLFKKEKHSRLFKKGKHYRLFKKEKHSRLFKKGKHYRLFKKEKHSRLFKKGKHHRLFKKEKH